jgi:L-amino acid N-acyltransferase
MDCTGMKIRSATSDDISAIATIYNNAILNTTATFDTVPKTIEEQRRWFEAHDPKHPVLIAEENGAVVGWASASAWSDRCAYAGTAENSVYVTASGRGLGVGRLLLEALIDQSRQAGLHTLIARIVLGNDASIRLHERCGFVAVGTMKEVGFKFGRAHDVLMMQKMLRGS